MNKVTIVVDMQNDFLDSKVLGNAETSAIVAPVYLKIEAAANNNDFVVFTRDTHDDNYLATTEGKKLPVPHCIEGTYGHEIAETLFLSDGLNYTVLDKNTFGTFNWDCLGDDLDEIELCGVCTDICVVTNALILKTMFPNVNIIVDANACAGTSVERHNAALEVMKSCQIEVIGG